MKAILIQSDSEANLKLLAELARKLGDGVATFTEDQLEDAALGEWMRRVKTGKSVSREIIMKKLRSE